MPSIEETFAAQQAAAKRAVAEHDRQHQGEHRPPLRETTAHPPRPAGRPDPQQVGMVTAPSEYDPAAEAQRDGRQ